MIKKIVMMCAAALLACAGAVADDGSDPGVLSPGEWTTDLTVNGKKVWSKYCQPKGAGWNCTYDSKKKSFTLTLLSPTEYTISGELTGRVMDKNSKVTKIETGKVSISQTSTVTLDSLTVAGRVDDAVVAIKDGKLVTIVLKGTSNFSAGDGQTAVALSIPSKATVTIGEGEEGGRLIVDGLCAESVTKKVSRGETTYPLTRGGRIVVNSGSVDVDSLQIDGLDVNDGCVECSLSALGTLNVNGGKFVDHGTWCYTIATTIGNALCEMNGLSAKTARINGRVRANKLSVSNLEISTGAHLEVANEIYGTKITMTDGLLEFPNADSEISFEKMTVSGGTITGKPKITGTECNSMLTVAGGEIQASRISGKYPSSISVKGGCVSSAETSLYQYRQSGGRFAVESGGSFKVQSIYQCAGTFMCGTRLRPADFECSKIYSEGGSLFPGQITPLSPSGMNTASGHDLRCFVIVGGLPANEKIALASLEFSYGVDDIWSDEDGNVYLLFPPRKDSYEFVAQGKVYEATVQGENTTATLIGLRDYEVVYRTFNGKMYDYEYGRWGKESIFCYTVGTTWPVAAPEDLKLTEEGRRFKHWRIDKENGKKIYPSKIIMPGETLGPVYGDYELYAETEEITADDVSKESEEGAAPVDPVKAGEKIVTVRFYLDPWESNPRDYVERDYIAGTRYGDLPVVTPPAGRVLDFWQYRTGGGFGGEKIDEDSIVRTENHCLYANWKLRPATEWTCQFVTKTGLSDDSDWSVFATHDFNIASPVAWMPSETPTRPRHRFVRWETYNDRECIMEPVTIGTIAAQRPSWVEAVWERDWFDWTRNRFESKILSAIVDGFPSDPALVKSVKGQGLAAGLKLVQDKTTKQWCLEGVPTELVDHATRDMFVAVTLKDGTKSTLLVKVRVNPEIPVVMRPAFVNENYGMCEYMHRLDENGRKLGSVAQLTPAEMRHPFVMADEYWPGAAKDWKITGLPAGLKFATKDATAWTDAAGIKQFAPLGSIYGFVKAPCAAIVTASHTVKGVAGGSYTESFKSTIEIHTYETTSDGYWVGGFLTDERIDGYVGEKIVCTFYSGHGLAGNTKFKFTGLPSGLSYTAVEKKVSGYEKPIPAGSIYGTLKKETKAWASGTDGSGRRPLTVIISFTERPPEVSVDAGAGGLLKAALMKFKPTEAAAIAETGTALMQGAAYKYRINCDAAAKVKVSGQPTGLKVVQNKDKKSADYGKWTLEGVPTKPGEYIAVITVTLNGVSTSITQRYVVKENAFAGEYRGVIASSPAADAAPRTGTILVNIAAGGATKVTVSEDGKSTLSYSAKSYGYSDSGDYAFVEFELKPSSADKKLGYGKRKGRVTISKPDAEVPDYRILEGVVKLEEGTAVGEVEGWFVAPGAADDFRMGVSRECRFFSCNDGGFDVPIATVRLEIKAGAKGKAATANVTGTLYDGTAVKLTKVPLVRDVAKAATGEEPNACYSFAPFAAKAKDGRVFVFHGFKRPVSWNELGAEGRVTFVNAAGEVVTVEEESGEGRTFAAMGFNSFFSHRYASSQMIFDYGWDGFESFALDHVSGAAKGDCVVLDVSGVEVTKIAAKNKVGLLGDFSYKFTTKDKIYTYQINLVTAPLARYLADGTIDWKESGRLVGFVTKTWKEGKTKKTLYGIVDIVGLKPAE